MYSLMSEFYVYRILHVLFIFFFFGSEACSRRCNCIGCRLPRGGDLLSRDRLAFRDFAQFAKSFRAPQIVRLRNESQSFVNCINCWQFRNLSGDFWKKLRDCVTSEQNPKRSFWYLPSRLKNFNVSQSIHVLTEGTGGGDLIKYDKTRSTPNNPECEERTQSVKSTDNFTSQCDLCIVYVRAYRYVYT